MKPARDLRQRLAEGQLTLGCLFTMHAWIDGIEMIRAAGMDYAIVDLEHLPHAQELVADICAIGRMTDFPILLRPQNTERDTIMAFADLGPCGMLLPMITGTADLDRIQSGLYMPPRGQRRPGGRALRWSPDGVGYAAMKRHLEDDFFIIAQIETPEALEQVDAIAAHPIVSALGIGPYDMSARFGCCWDPADPRLRGAFDTIRAAATRAGKPMWSIGDGLDLARRGFHFQCVTEPSFLLLHTLQNLVKSVRAEAAGKTAGESGEGAFVP